MANIWLSCWKQLKLRNEFGSFTRQITAAGKVPPAKVLVIALV